MPDFFTATKKRLMLTGMSEIIVDGYLCTGPDYISGAPPFFAFDRNHVFRVLDLQIEAGVKLSYTYTLRGRVSVFNIIDYNNDPVTTETVEVAMPDNTVATLYLLPGWHWFDVTEPVSRFPFKVGQRVTLREETVMSNGETEFPGNYAIVQVLDEETGVAAVEFMDEDYGPIYFKPEQLKLAPLSWYVGFALTGKPLIRGEARKCIDPFAADRESHELVRYLEMIARQTGRKLDRNYEPPLWQLASYDIGTEICLAKMGDIVIDIYVSGE